MDYAITGDPSLGYTVAFSRVWPVANACPCCGKPILTLRKAFLIAENLRLLSDIEGERR